MPKTISMKKAIGYCRISDHDQSNWSISGQQEMITEYCTKNGIELVAVFTDQGESAKNFDRSDWKLLEQFVKKNHQHVDFLLVMAWTRFSRNTQEALAMIEQLEQRYKIRIISITEPLQMHPDSPYFHYIRTQIIQNGELELRINRDRTRFGIHQAQKQGRYINKAPIGYLNAKDPSGQPIITIDETRAQVIRNIYDAFLGMQPIDAIKRMARKNGVSLAGNSSIQNILKNPTYMGYVRKIAYYDEPAGMIKGIHESIIPENTWWKVQAIFNRKGEVIRTKISDDFPFRAVLKCNCSRPLTGYFAHGKTKRVAYYKCNTHTKLNFNANRLHQQFDQVLDVLTLSPIQVQYLQDKISKEITEKLATRQQSAEKVAADITAVEKRISSVEEKFIDGSIDKETYHKWKRTYHLQKSQLGEQLLAMREPIEQVWARYHGNLDKLASITWAFHQLDVINKQQFIRTVFNNSLTYYAGIYRTPYMLDIFANKAVKLKEMGLLIYEQPHEKTAILKDVPPTGAISNPIHRLITIFQTIKTA